MLKTIEISKAQDMDLVNIINQTEGIAWRLNHDASHGRIPEKGIDDSIQKLMKTRDEAVVEIKKRTGISNHNDMIGYIKNKLKEQDEMWNAQWSEIYKEGSVFKFSGEDSPHVFETIRTYLPQRGTMGPKEYIFVRVRGRLLFNQLDDRDITRLTKFTENEYHSLYANCAPEIRGLIKSHEEPTKRKGKSLDEGKNWHRIDGWDHTVFYHKGFNETFEAVEKYNFPNVERCEKNEIILARSHIRPVLIEFTPADLGLIEIVLESPKYRNTGIHPYNLEK